MRCRTPRPQRIATDVGQAEAGVQQGAEAGRQSAIQDLQSYGIDPSAGRYAGLDTANRVMAGAAAAGAGNQQRMADIATGNAMQNQAISSSLQNVGQGIAGDQCRQRLRQDRNVAAILAAGHCLIRRLAIDRAIGQRGTQYRRWRFRYIVDSAPAVILGKLFATGPMAAGGPVGYQPGGNVSYADSPSRGAQTDDVQANLNAGEFVIPKDVAAWLGQEHFYKLMAKSRKDRAMAGSNGAPATGYGAA